MAGSKPMQQHFPFSFVIPAGALRRALIVALGVFLTGVLVFLLWWCTPEVDLRPWAKGPPPRVWSSWERQETLWRGQGLSRRVRHRYVPLESISFQLSLAVVAGEDAGFPRHGGVDPRAVGDAVREWWRGHALRGASTITQQLARVLFLSRRRTLARKVREARLAWWMERRLGKRRILELYLNVADFGPGLLGAEAAARAYYGLPASDLDAERAAGLAAALPAPSRDNPRTRSDRWRARREIILDRMARAPGLRRRLAGILGEDLIPGSPRPAAPAAPPDRLEDTPSGASTVE